MRRPSPSVFTIPGGRPFLDDLAVGILELYGDDPMALGRVTVLLPTRRACFALGDAFLRQRGGRPLLAPAMRAIGDIDEDELVVAGPWPEESGEDLRLPPPVPPLRRQLLLARLVLEMDRRRAAGPAATGPPMDEARAAHLAAELGRLLDQVQIERLSFEALASLAPDDYAAHWQVTLDFLKILTEHWPRLLAAEGLIDAVDRRNRLIAAQTDAWHARRPVTPVIAAGSTGSIPATAELLAVVAGLPVGAVVLPALDTELDAEAWAAVDPPHPQFGLKQLLERLNVAREDVRRWSQSAASASEPQSPRASLLSTALRPAAAAPAWRTDIAAEASAGLGWIDCPGPREEAVTIALLMREVLETPGHTAALITPDRALARRVAVELKRWRVDIDDSGGTPLARTPPGAFLRATAALCDEGAAPIPLLAALKHPLAAGGFAPGVFRAMVRQLERAILHGPRPARGLRGLRAAWQARSRAAEMPVLGRWLEAFEAAATPFAQALAAPTTTLDALLKAHLALAEFLAASDAEPGAARLWAGEAGEVAADFVDELGRASGSIPRLRGSAYRGLFDEVMVPWVVRPRYGRHPRLHIWGPLEARLQQAYLLILGGLNEGAWPTAPPADPWMSRPMREAMGLPPPDRRIGLAAHDFFSAACAPRVIFTRAEKVDGTPTVPSRWLLRLETLLGPRRLRAIKESGQRLAAWHRALDLPPRVQTIAPPAPRPPVSARPRRLRATEIEKWMRDPYAIYARRILGLEVLAPLDQEPGAAERGIFVHAALDTFVRRWPQELPPDALDQLLEIGREILGSARNQPGIAAFWWPRFERLAKALIAAETERRGGLRSILSECEGRLSLGGPAGPFTISAKADRIESRGDGTVALIDYKTGSVPQQNAVTAGLSPQLPIEAVIAGAGGFDGLVAAPVAELAYWRLTGSYPPAEFKPLLHDAEELRREAALGLNALIEAFDDETTPYLAVPRPDHAPRYNDYEHLERTREWTAVGEEDDP